jgi:hypothetical protein
MLFGQAVTASSTLAGTITDKSGAVILGATVTATENATNTSHTATTNSSGGYRFDVLAPGTYSLKVTMSGFANVAANSVELFVGRTTTQDFSLKPGATSETIEVNAEPPVLDLEKTSIGTEITPSQVEDLPLNGRDFGNLAYLAPGVKPVTPYDPTKQRYATFGINGSNGRNINVTVNGIDDKDGTVGGPVMQLPLEAVKEFNISVQRFSAVNGRSEGAAVNVVTKSGTNAYHGSGYFFDTATALNANDYLNTTNAVTGAATGNPTPQFDRQQFGGSIGGPVRKDKDFLFFTLERLREHTAIPVTSTAFNELSLVKNLGAQPVQSIPTPYFDWRYNGRYDHVFNEKHSFALSYNAQNNTGQNDQSTQTVDATQGNFTNNHLILTNATLSSALTSNLVNAATVGFQYWNNLIDTQKKSPTFNFPDAQFGTNGNVPQQSFQRKFQFKDDIAYQLGKHGLKWGVDYLYEPTLGGYFEFTPVLTWNFFDDPSVILSNTNLYPQGFATPGAVQTVAQAGGDPKFDLSGHMLGLYLQDDFKARPNLTLSLGLRYDHDFGLYGEDFQGNSRTYLALKAINSPFASSIPHEDNLDFSPRLGFAWDVGGTGRHVVRGGYGIYYGQTFENIPLFMMQQSNPTVFATLFSITHSGVTAACSVASCAVPGTNIPLSSYRFGVDPLPVPPGVLTNLPNGSTGRLMDPNFRNPASQQWNLGYAWQLNEASVIELDAIHELAVHEAKTINLNPIDPTTGVRILNTSLAAAGQPTLGSVSNNEAIGRSRYDGLNLSYRRRLSQHFSVDSTYTLSWARGYQGFAGNFGNTAVIPSQPFRSLDYGYVASDERHHLITTGTVQLPWGFQVAPIMQVGSPRPFNATEGITDVLGIGSGNGTFHAIGQASDPLHTLQSTAGMTSAQLRSCLAAGTCSEVHWDTLRGQTFFQLDNRVTKNIKIGERSNLKLMFQAFDITNRANFGNNFGGNIRTSTFGKPTNYITGNGTIVPKSFRGEFGAQFSF